MNNIQQQAHALFSEILLKSREYDSITLEDQVFPSGTGPIFSKGQERVINLSGTCGLLGYGHPINLKAKLFTLLDSENSKSGESLQSLMSDWGDFLSEQVGISVSFSPTYNPSPICTQVPGRAIQFLDKTDVNMLKKHNNLNLMNLFSFPSELYIGKTQKISVISSSVFYELKLVLKFLRDGFFYGEMGHVAHKANQIKEALQDLEGISLFQGLTFNINHPQSHKIALHNKQAIFPLSFDQKILQVIKKAFDSENS